jgi:hypothetical protein
MLGETVEIETVVPIRTSDQRKSVRALVGDRIPDTPAQMLHKRLCQRSVVIKRN